MGTHKASLVCQDALEGQTWDLVISTGYAAALTPSKIGAIVVADQVLLETSSFLAPQQSSPIRCHSGYTEEAFNTGMAFEKSTRLGRILTVPRIVSRALEKKDLALNTGAIGLDMESAVVGQVAKDRNIPFVAVRAISDLMDEELPEVFNLFLRPFGWVEGLPSIIKSPKYWGDLIRLQTQMVQTSRQMTRFFKLFLHPEHNWERQYVQKSAFG